MRLLNVHSLKLEEFGGEPGDGIPPYAILSHTWGVDEVSFREMTGDHADLAQREGFHKIVRCCEKARSEGHQFVWIDTCCIDKSGSAELSEAINSMFRWYRGADICYAYLDDVYPFEDPTEASSSFRESRWFTRGWTLQELLAPYEVVFLDGDWQEIGTKRSLSDIVSSQTKIAKQTLEDCTWGHVSIAAKMSWASSRVTKRVEDMAYCLMGLFDVNMPLIYGEGSKAFYRLQLEIMKSSDDQSIFAWIPAVGFKMPTSYGLLAESPKDFKLSYDIVDCTAAGGDAGGDTGSYDVSKQYVRLSMPMLDLMAPPFSKDIPSLRLHSQFLPPNKKRSTTASLNLHSSAEWTKIKIAVLYCRDEVGYISIPLKRLKSGEFERVACQGLKWLRTRTCYSHRSITSMLVRAFEAPRTHFAWPSSARFLEVSHHVPIGSLSILESGYFISGGYPPNLITTLGQRPTPVEAIARINQALWAVGGQLIVFFAHETPAYPPFALRFYRSRTSVAIHVRMGAAIKEVEEVTPPAEPQEDEKLVGSYEQIYLSEEKSLFIRTRKLNPGPRVQDFVNISIGPRLSWQPQTLDRGSSAPGSDSERRNS
jgi:hypothetical protein